MQNIPSKELLFKFSSLRLVTVWTVLTIAFTTVTSFQMICFRKNDKAFFA